MWPASLFCENYSLRADGSQIHSKCVGYCGNLATVIFIFSNQSSSKEYLQQKYYPQTDQVDQYI